MKPFVKSIKKPAVYTFGKRCLAAICHNPDTSKEIIISWEVILFQYVPEINIKIIGVYKRHNYKDNLIEMFIFPEEILFEEKHSTKTTSSVLSFILKIPESLSPGRYYIQCETNYNTGYESNSFRFSQELRISRLV